MARLLIQSGPNAGRIFELKSKVMSLGRSSENEVCIIDDSVSRKHGMLKRVRDKFVYLDLGSTNGTSINNKVIGEKVLDHGDRILLGNTLIIFEEYEDLSFTTALERDSGRGRAPAAEESDIISPRKRTADIGDIGRYREELAYEPEYPERDEPTFEAEIQREMNKRLRRDMKKEIEKEIRREVEMRIKTEMEAEQRRKEEAKMRSRRESERTRRQIKARIERELRAELEAEQRIREELEEEVRERLRREIREELEEKFRKRKPRKTGKKVKKKPTKITKIREIVQKEKKAFKLGEVPPAEKEEEEEEELEQASSQVEEMEDEEDIVEELPEAVLKEEPEEEKEDMSFTDIFASEDIKERIAKIIKDESAPPEEEVPALPEPVKETKPEESPEEPAPGEEEFEVPAQDKGVEDVVKLVPALEDVEIKQELEEVPEEFLERGAKVGQIGAGIKKKKPDKTEGFTLPSEVGEETPQAEASEKESRLWKGIFIYLTVLVGISIIAFLGALLWKNKDTIISSLKRPAKKERAEEVKPPEPVKKEPAVPSKAPAQPPPKAGKPSRKPSPPAEEISVSTEEQAEVNGLISSLKSNDFKEVVKAKRTLKNKGRVAIPALVDIIQNQDEDIYVRIIAIQTLGGIGDKAVIPHLIVTLGLKSTLRNEGAKVLRRITGQSLGKDQDAWSGWWDENESTFALKKAEWF